MDKSEEARGRKRKPNQVRLETKPTNVQSSDNDDDSSNEKQTKLEDKKSEPTSAIHWPEQLKWVKDNWTWSKVKPVVRCAVAAWISLVLFVIPAVQRFLGQVRSRPFSIVCCSHG
jgi:hypothetical protein